MHNIEAHRYTQDNLNNNPRFIVKLIVGRYNRLQIQTDIRTLAVGVIHAKSDLAFHLYICFFPGVALHWCRILKEQRQYLSL